MIERKLLAEKLRENEVQEFIAQTMKNVGHSHTKVTKTPLGEKITIFTSRPGLVVGRKGENIKKLTVTLKKRFNFENPQIEISEVEQPDLDAQIVAERIASTMERFGIQKFKGIAHKTMQDAINAGALGIEIIISGKVPSARAKSWRFCLGYLKKSGDVALTGVRKAMASAQMKSGTVGIKVAIMPSDIALPDDITIKQDEPEKKEPVEHAKEAKEEPKPAKETKKSRKKAQPAEKAEEPGEAKE